MAVNAIECVIIFTLQDGASTDSNDRILIIGATNR